MKLTVEQKRAIKRVCEKEGFENYRELKSFMKSYTEDTLDYYWFDGKSEDECYKELVKYFKLV